MPDTLTLSSILTPPPALSRPHLNIPQLTFATISQIIPQLNQLRINSGKLTVISKTICGTNNRTNLFFLKHGKYFWQIM